MKELNNIVKIIVETGNQIVQIKDRKNKNSFINMSQQISYERLKYFALESKLPFISKFDKVDFEIRKNWNSFWILSPILGIKNLREEKDDFLIGITKIENQRPSLVVLFAPVKNELFIGKNNKAYKISNFNTSQILNEFLIGKNEINKPIESVYFTILKSKKVMNLKTENFLLDFKVHKKGTIREIIDESPMNLIRLAEGKYDFYPHLQSVSEWDIAPFDALITFSGNRVTATDGILPLSYNNKKQKFTAYIAKNNLDIDSIDLKD